ncbi:uncharacterized protein BDW43DRAFT_233037 [Aspergillus alliaceus]|uniref:uncharacterized protein n=1 Tax=Petromyces alliaceus TaxID=209559 RepID=UPI0012A583EB|nr:uncharacterized protein BDW43DRAFT_233037 [Aspergillus alliaceus]KAB8228013.1 hypothetical protein BDW43DRAFT_233037 [Aspergillus alliaceus]
MIPLLPSGEQLNGHFKTFLSLTLISFVPSLGTWPDLLTNSYLCLFFFRRGLFVLSFSSSLGSRAWIDTLFRSFFLTICLFVFFFCLFLLAIHPTTLLLDIEHCILRIDLSFMS